MEHWKPIPDYPYEVSSEGQVRSLDRFVQRRGSMHRCKGRTLKPWKDGGGYRLVNLCREGTTKAVHIHRLVLEAFVGPAPPRMEAAHGDGDRSNNGLSNLRWTTRKDNHADKITHGTLRSGERVYISKLNDAIVRELRAAKLKPGDQRRLAKKYGVSNGVICEAISGKTWKHVSSIPQL